MTQNVEKTIGRLASRVREALDAAGSEVDAMRVAPLLDALQAGRFSFEREAWHDLKPQQTGGTCGELLLRALTEDSSRIDPEEPARIINQCGAHAEFDTLIALAAIRQAIENDELPVSINISSNSACDDGALMRLHSQLEKHFGDRLDPSKITFEFLEGSAAENPDHASLTELHRLGYTFAIDDQSHKEGDSPRLKNLGPYADYIKIDGPTLEGFKDRDIRLHQFEEFLQDVRRIAPQAEILCEWVASPEDAYRLHELFPEIRFVQGRNLPSSSSSFAEDVNAARQKRETAFTTWPA